MIRWKVFCQAGNTFLKGTLLTRAQSSDPETVRDTREWGERRAWAERLGKVRFLPPSLLCLSLGWATRSPGGKESAPCAHRKVCLQTGEVAEQGLAAPIILQVAP